MVENREPKRRGPWRKRPSVVDSSTAGELSKHLSGTRGSNDAPRIVPETDIVRFRGFPSEIAEEPSLRTQSRQSIAAREEAKQSAKPEARRRKAK
jgi:hypothetical protein